MSAFDWIAYVLLPALVLLGAPLALCLWAEDDEPDNARRYESSDPGSGTEEGEILPREDTRASARPVPGGMHLAA